MMKKDQLAGNGPQEARTAFRYEVYHAIFSPQQIFCKGQLWRPVDDPVNVMRRFSNIYEWTTRALFPIGATVWTSHHTHTGSQGRTEGGLGSDGWELLGHPVS